MSDSNNNRQHSPHRDSQPELPRSVKYRPHSTIGDYVLDELLGAGGFGEVWKGHHVGSKEIVSVKIATQDKALASLHKEVKVSQELPEGVSPPFHHSFFDHDPPYLVRQWWEGTPLREVCKTYGSLDWIMASNVIIRLLGLLNKAHQVGVVHGDLKPENIILHMENYQTYHHNLGQGDFERKDRWHSYLHGSRGKGKRRSYRQSIRPLLLWNHLL